MANTKTIFLSSKRSEHNSEMECSLSHGKEICLEIWNGETDAQFIYLDISTAIKLSKVLRTEINKAKEVSNG